MATVAAPGGSLEKVYDIPVSTAVPDVSAAPPREFFFADDEGYFPRKVTIHEEDFTGHDYRVHVNFERLNRAIEHIGLERRRFGWPHAVERHRIRDVVLVEGGSYPSWMADLAGEDQLSSDALPLSNFDPRSELIGLYIPFGLMNLPGRTTEQTAEALEHSLNRQADKGFLQRTGMNIMHRRWHNFFHTSVGLAMLAGAEAGQYTDSVPTGLAAFAGTAAIGAAVTFVQTRGAYLNHSAAGWARRRFAWRTTDRWLNTDTLQEPIITLEPDTPEAVPLTSVNSKS